MIGQLFTSTGSILVHNKVVHFPSNLSLYIAFPFQILVAYLWKVSVLLCSIIVYCWKKMNMLFMIHMGKRCHWSNKMIVHTYSYMNYLCVWNVTVFSEIVVSSGLDIWFVECGCFAPRGHCRAKTKAHTITYTHTPHTHSHTHILDSLLWGRALPLASRQ